jgi:hypothetical protein
LLQSKVVKVMVKAISAKQMQQVHEAMLSVNAALEAQLR